MGWMHWGRCDQHLDLRFIDALDWPDFAALGPQEEDRGVPPLAGWLPPLAPARDYGDGLALDPQAAETEDTGVPAPARDTGVPAPRLETEPSQYRLDLMCIDRYLDSLREHP